MEVDGRVVNCLCGVFQADWLPVSLRSWSPVRLVYSVADYAWSSKGFTFRSSYAFHNDGLCGDRTITLHSGGCSFELDARFLFVMLNTVLIPRLLHQARCSRATSATDRPHR